MWSRNTFTYSDSRLHYHLVTTTCISIIKKHTQPLLDKLTLNTTLSLWSCPLLWVCDDVRLIGSTYTVHTCNQLHSYYVISLIIINLTSLFILIWYHNSRVSLPVNIPTTTLPYSPSDIGQTLIHEWSEFFTIHFESCFRLCVRSVWLFHPSAYSQRKLLYHNYDPKAIICKTLINMLGLTLTTLIFFVYTVGTNGFFQFVIIIIMTSHAIRYLPTALLQLSMTWFKT